MDSLRNDFLTRTLAALENLVEDLRGETENFSEIFRREAFRTLHTIKGTSQAIGFPASGKLAHELENLLAVANNQPKNSDELSSGESCKNLLLEGLQHLKKTFERTDFKVPTAFLEQIGARLSHVETEPQTDFSKIPDAIFSQLTKAEKGALASALQNEKEIFCLEINFDSANFADEFIAFRQTLCEKCEIIATLPATKTKRDAPAEISFQILLSTAEDIENILEKTSAEIVFQFPSPEFSNNLKSVFAHVAAHGESLAKQFGRQIAFEIAAIKDGEISPKILKTIFDSLTHLVRNAVDHAIETPEERRARNKSPRGTIKIDFAKRENGFYLSVADDGRGIDAKKIKAKATEKKLISSGDDLPEKAALDFIFLPEFSTRARLTDISGRGIGLDAVKYAVEKIGGNIAVKSKWGKGTTFEIFLPRET